MILLDVIARSILMGSIYSLMALGLTMTCAASRIPNFAHCELVTLGAYACAVSTIFYAFRLPEAVLAAVVTSVIVALLMYQVYKSLLKRALSRINMMVATMAIAIITRYSIHILVGVLRVWIIKPNIEIRVVYNAFGMVITNAFLIIVPTVLIIIVLLHMFLTRTKIGKAMRSTVYNPQLAEACGIDVNLMSTITWGISGGLAGIAGAFWSLLYYVNPTVGSMLSLSFFAASVLGGLVSIYGTVAGGYIISFSENLIIGFLSSNFGVKTGYKPIISFGVMLLVLLLRPEGLSGISITKIFHQIRDLKIGRM